MIQTGIVFDYLFSARSRSVVTGPSLIVDNTIWEEVVIEDRPLNLFFLQRVVIPHRCGVLELHVDLLIFITVIHQLFDHQKVRIGILIPKITTM